jgi:hypothetical protein
MGIWRTGKPQGGGHSQNKGALDEVPRPLFWECPLSRGSLQPLLWNVPHLAALPITKQARGECYLEPKIYADHQA